MVLLLPRRSRTRGLPDPSSAVAEQLRRHGWTAQQVEYDASVEPDPRLRVLPGTEVSAVELLLPARPEGPTRWQAVRVGSDDGGVADRVVWSGPAGTCPPEELVAFLESLLLCPECDLIARYDRLG